MAPQAPAATGWPFLVAAGRRRDYSTLLAPDFLVADLDYGVLDEVVRPSDERGPATVVQARTRAGRHLTVAYATHLLTAADIGLQADPTDEHGRPLRLIYGFVCAAGRVATPAEADLRTAREVALAVYRRFLADEDDITITPGSAFALKTPMVIRPQPEPQPRRPVQKPVGRPTGGRPIAVGLTVLLGLMVAAVFGIVLLLRPSPIEPAPCPTATAAAGLVASPSPSPSCVRRKAVSANRLPPLNQRGVRTPATPRSEEETQA